MKKVINTNKAPLSVSPVSQCNIINGTIYIGGQMPRDMISGQIVKGAYEQAKLSMEHCLTILHEAGGSIETIIDDKTGFLFEAGNPNKLSEKIAEVLNLSEVTLNGMGAEGRKNVIKKFNVEKMCFSTYSEYKKLLN